ncbi:hypothetical protein J437_LFUL008617 [Ladona fulva]|uniref:CCDC92/74 N-terminal domain-containing protein n=1 Tax=Ladona fulva TaxID=123851 RepID=A0A8K0P329_LADFU|nr:hypothetical protein J437_LFUL008617 [Ladona fulva]
MEESLLDKIKVLESNYSFLKKEHATLIKGLHEEIERLQRKYSELAFEHTMRADKSSEIVLLEDKITQLQVSVKEKNEEIQLQKENLSTIYKRHQEEETKLLARIEEQKKTIDNLQEILTKNKESIRDSPGQSEKGDRPKKEAQSEKIHKRKKKKSASSCVYESVKTRIVPDNSSINEMNSKILANKSSKSAITSCTGSPPLKTIENSTSENEYNQKKGRKEGHKRGRKKSSSLHSSVGDVPILPSDYRSVVATLPPISHSCEEPPVECDMHKFIPSCSTTNHASYSSAVKSDVDPINLSQLHKGLRNPSLKVEISILKNDSALFNLKLANKRNSLNNIKIPVQDEISSTSGNK